MRSRITDLRLPTINESSIRRCVSRSYLACNKIISSTHIVFHFGYTDENRPTHQFARSLMYVARFHLDRGGGDIARARQYAERVSQSNSEEVTFANELLKRIQQFPLNGSAGANYETSGTQPGMPPSQSSLDALITAAEYVRTNPDATGASSPGHPDS